MRVRFVLGVIAVAGILAAVPGQSGSVRAQGGGTLPPGMAAESARAMTPFEVYADRLGLDEKTQTPKVQEIFLASTQDAAGPARELLQIRQQILNIDLGSQPETDRKAAMDAYMAAALKIAQVEANTMSKVFALLRPNQQNKVPNAFLALQGMFQLSAPGGGGRGRG
jgi:hypothetical protein